MRRLFLKLLSCLGIASTIPSVAAPKNTGELKDHIREKSELAVREFQERAGGRLDFTEKSLGVVEEMLDEASAYVKQMEATQVKTVIELMGSYILDVAQRANGGKFYWHEDKAQPVLVVGEPNFRVALITFDKVRGRVNGDKADNIVFFYDGFAGRVRSAKPGTNVLYV